MREIRSALAVDLTYLRTLTFEAILSTCLSLTGNVERVFKLGFFVETVSDFLFLTIPHTGCAFVVRGLFRALPVHNVFIPRENLHITKHLRRRLARVPKGLAGKFLPWAFQSY